MATLKVPSLQHLARNWDSDPQQVKQNLVRLAKHPPNFNYALVYKAIREILVFKTPYSQIIKRINESVKRDDLKKNYLSILALAHNHFNNLNPRFVQTVSTRHYSIGRDLKIPFNPVLIYGTEDKIYFPWFSFWMKNPLDGERLSLFVSVVYEVLLQDPDLDESIFEILDFSMHKPKCDRELTITNAREIPILDRRELTRMLTVFAEGFRLAKLELTQTQKPNISTEESIGDDSIESQLRLIPDDK